MSFENPVINNQFVKCWDRAYRWSGGAKQKTLEDGTIARVVEAQIKSYNSTTKENDLFPPEMKIAVIGVTTQIGGGTYDQNNPANNARFYSNEVLNTFDQKLRVFKKTATGTEKLYDDVYQNFKDTKPQGMELQVNIYFYSFQNKTVNRLELTGSARNEWYGSKLNNKNLYEHWLKIEKGEMKTTGQTDFVVPKYTLGDSYTPEERMEIVDASSYKEYAAWEKRLLNPEDSFSQVTPGFEDPGSQEVETIVDEDAPINLDDIPF